ncbi:MAG TPA: carbamoyltransferase HypF [Candidatus Krumholzibacteria bacterium]|nr:carbamoyltransferase HypF [Candidatus Krumholzibacteria bacterium]HPD70337.1 carbamoyltransferase HypF [Candidatus Krumholzibacteria bacterium]HRY39963.1 carbamoyltransferase HypF [Candidatus Krumholzibacteria bacterium]
MEARRIHITGVVQGVGFRPFVWTLARRFDLGGWVRNSSSGVDIHVEGDVAALTAFERALAGDAPPLAAIDRVAAESVAPQGHAAFTIVPSLPEPGESLPVAADVATCADCLRELNDPNDRRHGYPFLNCTNCGPRFTIVRDIPYDRPHTTMAGFPLCPACAAEYADPANRRFHAQPVACPACGPQVWLERAGARASEGPAAVAEVRRLLAAGQVLAIKGLGGFHLACDATNAAAVALLRERKRRHGKPFALMTADLASLAQHAEVSAAERELLLAPARPVVLLRRRADSPIAADVAPGRDRFGFMLPYTPLHHLLFVPGPHAPAVLVMTSANLSDDPIAYRNEEARERLADLTDAFLLHDRPIHVRCDDSVATVFRDAPYLLRRSRGYAPLPVTLPFAAPQLLACGGELKNVFCLSRDARAFLGHHIGELEYHETLRAFHEGIAHFERLFRVQPSGLVHDLHPDYQATRYARERAARDDVPAIAVQHHHAHVAACLADNGCPAPTRVIGVAFDGTGYGPDGVIWGGEFLVAGYADFERALHLRPCPLPGGDAAARHPWRAALAWLREMDLDWSADLPPVAATGETERAVLAGQLAARINTPLTTSMGRLFDAAAALAGLAPSVTYEAQAACELEAAAAPGEDGAYPFAIADREIDPRPALAALVGDRRRGEPLDILAARFHNGVAAMVAAACDRLRRDRGLTMVALSGGVWQNLVLLERTVARLEAAGFAVLVHRQVPANDGGLSLGQIAAAAARLARE